jgi:hypothetical protein
MKHSRPSGGLVDPGIEIIEKEIHGIGNTQK